MTAITTNNSISVNAVRRRLTMGTDSLGSVGNRRAGSCNPLGLLAELYVTIGRKASSFPVVAIAERGEAGRGWQVMPRE